MHKLIPSEEAVRCRRQATGFQGRPEAAFLLQVAAAFDDLATTEKRNFSNNRVKGQCI